MIFCESCVKLVNLQRNMQSKSVLKADKAK